MRPGDFSPGNIQAAAFLRREHIRASMRPGDFSPGNLLDVVERTLRAAISQLQ